METELVVHRDRTNIITVSLGIDVSEDELVSEIREKANIHSELIAAWEIEFLTDGKDGECIFKIDDEVAAEITQNSGFMDIKRVVNGEPLSVFNEPLTVMFRGVVTE